MNKTDHSAQLNAKGEYFKYPVWNNYETKGYKLKGDNFQQPWYKNKKTSNIKPENLKLTPNSDIYKLLYNGRM